MRLLVALSLLPLFLFSYDFSKCQEIVSKALYPIGKSHGVAISPDELIYFSTSRPPAHLKIIKFDPFLNLYLLKSPEKREPLTLWYTYDLEKRLPLASLDSKSASRGVINSWSEGVDKWGEFTGKITENSVIAGICYHMYGLGIGQNRFYEARVIKRFLNSSRIYYGDIGIRVKQTNAGVEVLYVDPFVKNNPFRRGDIITHLKGKKVNRKMLLDRVIDAREGNRLEVTFRRDGKILKRLAYVDRRYGGGFLADTFLEKLGLLMGDKLAVQGLAPYVKKELRWLKPDDRLIEIDRKRVYNLHDLKNAFTLARGRHIKLLFERDDFQFFIQLQSEKERY